MPTITLTWRAQLDNRTCPICKAINGYIWAFETGKNPIPPTLTHPSYGVVWNVATGSMAHGHTNINCRCRLEPFIDVSDLSGKIETWKHHLEAEIHE